MQLYFLIAFTSALPFDWPHWVENLVHPQKPPRDEDPKPIQVNPLSRSLTTRSLCEDVSFCGNQAMVTEQYCVRCPKDMSGGGCPHQACMTGGATICEWVFQPVAPCAVNATAAASSTVASTAEFGSDLDLIDADVMSKNSTRIGIITDSSSSVSSSASQQQQQSRTEPSVDQRTGPSRDTASEPIPVTDSTTSSAAVNKALRTCNGISC